MGFQDLLNDLKKQPLQELRTCSENYFEAVVATSGLSGVEGLLGVYFGTPLKPAGSSPSGDANRFSKPYGGIRSAQTMYLLKKETGNEIAFLWPWGYGTQVTLKLILENQPQRGQGEGKPSGSRSFWKMLFGK